MASLILKSLLLAKQVFFYFMEDSEGRVMVAVEEEQELGPTGLAASWIHAGDLETTLLDYQLVAAGYGDPECCSGPYTGMWPHYLSRIGIVREYILRFVDLSRQKRLIPAYLTEEFESESCKYIVRVDQRGHVELWSSKKGVVDRKVLLEDGRQSLGFGGSHQDIYASLEINREVDSFSIKLVDYSSAELPIFCSWQNI